MGLSDEANALDMLIKHAILITNPLTCHNIIGTVGVFQPPSLSMGGSLAEWLACWYQAQKGLGSNHSRDAVG